MATPASPLWRREVERGDRLFVLRPKTRRRQHKPRYLTSDEPLLDIVGMRASGEPGNDVASDKYKYVADAVASHFERRQGEWPTEGKADTEAAHTEPASAESL